MGRCIDRDLWEAYRFAALAYDKTLRLAGQARDCSAAIVRVRAASERREALALATNLRQTSLPEQSDLFSRSIG